MRFEPRLFYPPNVLIKNEAMYSIKALPHSGYAAPDDDSLNRVLTAAEQMTLETCGFRCGCCGLVSAAHRDYPSGYMEVFQRDDVDYVLCSMCMQSQHLGRRVNGKSNHGLIIYCPSLSQGELIKLAQWAFLARLRGNAFAPSANKLIGMITRNLVEPASYRIPGFNSGDVSEFADIYEHLSPKLKDNSSTLFSDLKYWPNEVVFEPQMNFWNVAAFRNVTDEIEGLCQGDTAANGVTV